MLLYSVPPRRYVCCGMPCIEQERPSWKKKKIGILRKILCPVKENEEWRRWHNHEFYTHVKKITNSIRKRKTTAVGESRFNSSWIHFLVEVMYLPEGFFFNISYNSGLNISNQKNNFRPESSSGCKIPHFAFLSKFTLILKLSDICVAF